MTPAPVCVADGLTKRFGDRVAVREVSFAVDAGELVAIAGPNGAGKTTLLSILAGALSPDGGSLTLGDGAPDPAPAPTRPRGVGWVPQVPAVYGKLSVVENLRLFARLERVADVEATVARMLEQADLADRADEPVARLSGGNRQRVNIAVGLLADPVLLLLDEPSASLDPRQRERLWEFIAGLTQRGTSVVFSSHDVAEVDRHAGRLLLLADGELLFTGTPTALRGAAPDLETALLARLRDHGH